MPHGHDLGMLYAIGSNASALYSFLIPPLKGCKQGLCKFYMDYLIKYGMIRLCETQYRIYPEGA